MIVERAFQRKYEYIFDKFTTGIMVIDESGCICEVNQNALDLLGVERQDIEQQPVRYLQTKFKIASAVVNQLSIHLKNEQSASEIFPIMNGSGLFKSFKLTIHWMAADQMYFVLLEDFTEHLSLKERLAQSESLNNLGQLAASIAHEIRNPMTSLKGFAQLMERETSDRGCRYIRIIEQELDRIDKILNEFLTLSKPKQLDIEMIEGNELIQCILDFMSPQALLTGIRIDFDKQAPLYFEADRLLTKQLLINSIKNAIEAMQDGGTIHVALVKKEDEVIISVQDEGEGIDLEKLPMYFEAFYTTKEKGTGLGLAHAAQVMKDLNGRIEIDNNLSGGASFYYYFPVKHRQHVLT